MMFGDVGYALLSNAFIDRINAVFGTDLAPVDLAAELADDPYSPAAARAAGVDPEACQ